RHSSPPRKCPGSATLRNGSVPANSTKPSFVAFTSSAMWRAVRSPSNIAGPKERPNAFRLLRRRWARQRSPPIVMASSPNAAGDGLVASLAHPGGNVTGQSVYAPELTRKRFELLKEAVPGLSRVAALWNARNLANRGQLQEAETAGRALGI